MKNNKYIRNQIITAILFVIAGVGLGVLSDYEKSDNTGQLDISNNISTKVDIEKNSDFKNIADLKNYYEYNNNILSPIFNVDQEETFQVYFKTSDTLPDDAIGVYTNKECNEESRIETVNNFEKNSDGQKVEIKPYIKTLSKTNDIGWGNAPIYFIKIDYSLDAEKVEKLDKSLIIPFRTKDIVETPILRCTISENGIFKLNWSKVANATGYRIYKTDSTYLNNETGASTGYKNNVPRLITEVSSDVNEWYDWVNNGTNGLGTVNGEATIYENFGLNGEYYITALVNDKESKYSNSILVSNYADILPVRINNDDLLNPGDYVENVRDLPRTIEIKTLNNDMIKYNVNYTIDETTRYTDNVYYNYKIKGTKLKGYIEIKVGDVTNLPSEIKNGIETYEDDYNIKFNVIQSKSEVDNIININDWINMCNETESDINKQDLLNIDVMSEYDLNKISCEDYFLLLNLLNYNTEIDLSGFQNIQDYIELEDKIQKICYQNPLIYGVKAFSYNENTKKLKVVYTDNIDRLKEKKELIYNKVISMLPLIIKSNGNENNINDIYTYMNDNYIYNKDGDLYELVQNNNGNALAYSQLFKLLCDEMGLDSILVSGSLNGNLHTWNAVRYKQDNENNENSENWYYIDTTNNLKNIGMQRMCYNMSSEYAKKIGYLSNNKYTEDSEVYIYKSSKDDYEYYNNNGLIANNPEEYFNKVKQLVENDTKVITIRYIGDEIKSSELIANISNIFREAKKELELGRLKFGDGLGYYVLWYEN